MLWLLLSPLHLLNDMIVFHSEDPVIGKREESNEKQTRHRKPSHDHVQQEMRMTRRRYRLIRYTQNSGYHVCI